MIQKLIWIFVVSDIKMTTSNTFRNLYNDLLKLKYMKNITLKRGRQYYKWLASYIIND